MIPFNNKIRSYSELILLPTFQERFNYLKLGGKVGSETFGYDRYLNQKFYHSYEWQRIRDYVIIRDNGCDLGIDGYFIQGGIILHHMNQVEPIDYINRTDWLLNPDYLICVSLDTHNAIHYGDPTKIPNRELVERRPNDTCPWKN